MDLLTRLFLGKQHICPSWCAFSLDNIFRKIFHNPEKILRPYIKKGDFVADIGCGPGYFTIPLSKMVGKKGKVIAVDVQEKMLKKLRKNIGKNRLYNNINIFQVKEENINLKEKVNFILAFYMIHETPHIKNFLKQIKKILLPKGLFFLAEPKIHVSSKEFQQTIQMAQSIGFKPYDQPKIWLSRTMIFKV